MSQSFYSSISQVYNFHCQSLFCHLPNAYLYFLIHRCSTDSTLLQPDCPERPSRLAFLWPREEGQEGLRAREDTKKGKWDLETQAKDRKGDEGRKKGAEESGFDEKKKGRKDDERKERRKESETSGWKKKEKGNR